MSTPVLRFRRDQLVTPVLGDGVFVSGEGGRNSRLHGAAVTAAYPLLDGSRNRTSVVAALAAEFGEDSARSAVEALLDSGHVVEVDPAVDVRKAGYFEHVGLPADGGVRALERAVIGVLAIGAAEELDVDTALAGAGLRTRALAAPSEVGAGCDVLMVVTDDYLRVELSEVNALAAAHDLPWLPVRPFGDTVWLGPMIRPGRTACHECLAVRLRSKNLAQSYLRQRGAELPETTVPVTGLDSGITAALNLAAHLVALHLAGEPGGDDTAEVVTLDLSTWETKRHTLVRRPQCPVCGDASRQRDRMLDPVRLRSTPTVVRNDGGHRAVGPADFVATYEHLVSPITGPVSHLTELPEAGPGLHVYTAGQNFAMPMRGLADLKAGLRSMSCGKGQTRIQAKASALGEAIERYSGLFHGDEPRRLARAVDLAPEEFVHPNDIHHFSEAQFRDRAEWNRRPSHFHWVGEPLDESALVEWTPAWSLTHDRPKLVPTDTLFYAYDNPVHPFHGSSNSNGCAAGSSLEDAVLQGFMELVERDATAIWWYNRLRRPRVDLDSFGVPYFASWQEQYRRLNRAAWVLDLTTDLGIPTVAAVSYRTDKASQDILFSLGSHFDMTIAIGRALSEMNQFVGPVAHLPADGSGEYTFSDQAQVDFWRTETVERNPYLLPDDSAAPVVCGDYRHEESGDLAEEVRRAQSIVEGAGMELLVVDQTRVDVGLPVARVMVPGLRHFWPRYAPGRLYDVPVSLGWLQEPTAEADLNPLGVLI